MLRTPQRDQIPVHVVQEEEPLQLGPRRLLTLHRIRHSTLTHDAEGGSSTPMLLARSRHASVRSLERYARPASTRSPDT